MALPSLSDVDLLLTRSVGALFRRPWRLAGRLLRPGNAAGPRPTGSRGVVVVGHGTADPVGAAETRRVAELVAGMLPDVAVELGFLEVIGPPIGDALARLAARGCAEVVAAPLLLFTAGHARRDVPEALSEGAARAGLDVRQSAALGCHPHIVALSRQRRREAVAGLAPVPAAETVLLMIGRGSSDPTAHHQLQAFAAATCGGPSGDPAASGCPAPARIELGFVAAARPSLDEGIALAAGRGCAGNAVGGAAGGETAGAGRVRRVIVQPHLLFRGHVEEQVSAALARARAAHPDIEWVQVERLGADPLVARTVVERVAELAGGSGGLGT